MTTTTTTTNATAWPNGRPFNAAFRDDYEAAIERLIGDEEAVLSSTATDDLRAVEANVKCDALAALAREIKAGAAPWADYDEPEATR